MLVYHPVQWLDEFIDGITHSVRLIIRINGMTYQLTEKFNTYLMVEKTEKTSRFMVRWMGGGNEMITELAIQNLIDEDTNIVCIVGARDSTIDSIFETMPQNVKIINVSPIDDELFNQLNVSKTGTEGRSVNQQIIDILLQSDYDGLYFKDEK